MWVYFLLSSRRRHKMCSLVTGVHACALPISLTIFARNPVHSVLLLIMVFFNAAGVMVLLQAEFIAMLLVIVYVGAVAVLFLFVVMMLDSDFAELRAGFVEYLPFGALVAILLVTEIVLGVGAWKAGGIELEIGRAHV